MKRLLLIDGHSMAYRAYYALPVENFQSSKGQATNAIYGFGSMLTNLIASEKPTHIAVAFDVSRKTFRTELFPEYKGTRAATPDEFRSQMSYLFELVAALNICHFAIEGFEADDILATLSSRAAVTQSENQGILGEPAVPVIGVGRVNLTPGTARNKHLELSLAIFDTPQAVIAVKGVDIHFRMHFQQRLVAGIRHPPGCNDAPVNPCGTSFHPEDFIH